MRKLFRTLVLMTMLLGAGAASAQIIDPSTGIPVDPMTDPVDYTNMMSGQPTNIGLELGAQANAEAQQIQQQMNAQIAQNAANFASADDATAPAVPAVPRTPKPAMTPNGGKFRGGVQVTLTDKDAKAVIHYTTDGSKPTVASPVYAGPVSVTGKTKVRALAVDGKMPPSGVVTKTFKVKS